MRQAHARILIFARAPIPGRCKTRLIGSLGAHGAARVQRELLHKTLETAVASGLAPVELWCAPDCSHPAFQRLRSEYGVRLQQQAAGDLGRRMSEALRRSLRHASRAILIGTDCPALTSQHLALALDALKNHTTVFQPAADGGYVLVGASRSEPRLFRNIPWGTAHVMPRTRHRLKQLNTVWSELPTLWDVDHPADLRRARQEGLLEP